VIAFKLLYRFDLAEKSMSLFVKELDLDEFLVTQVALPIFSLAMEEACEGIIAEPHALSLVACEVVELLSDIVSSFATRTAVVDVPVVIVGSPSPLTETLELQAIAVIRSPSPFADALELQAVAVVGSPSSLAKALELQTVAVVGSPSPLAEALELQAIDILVSFAAKPPYIARVRKELPFCVPFRVLDWR
jgi:hypothetical protein